MSDDGTMTCRCGHDRCFHSPLTNWCHDRSCGCRQFIPKVGAVTPAVTPDIKPATTVVTPAVTPAAPSLNVTYPALVATGAVGFSALALAVYEVVSIFFPITPAQTVSSILCVALVYGSVKAKRED